MTQRAVSTVVNYVIALGIMSVMITGLVLAGGTYVQDQREQTARAELEVIGQRISGDLSAAARMAAAGETTSNVEIVRHFPETVAGLTYRIELDPNGGSPVLRLRTDSPDITVTIPVALTRAGSPNVATAPATVGGGDLTVTYDSGSNEVTLAS